jgi:nicotinate-nucleotide pyrophosphorylase (carboxylating)
MLPDETRQKIRAALEEDLGLGDLTTEAIMAPAVRGRAALQAREYLVLAGLTVARETFAAVDGALQFVDDFHDGDRVPAGARIARIEGSAASILKAERVALNFLQHLSGVATLTAAFVERVSGLPVQILDTRKTIPGLRRLEKYAVRMGGGTNHRMGLHDAVLIKDNHVAVAGGIAPAVEKVRARIPTDAPIEVEVTSLAEVREALEAGADLIMLDNMDLDTMVQAVRFIDKRARTEASGNIRLENVRAVAQTGVDRISIGALTHSVRAVDISLEMVL